MSWRQPTEPVGYDYARAEAWREMRGAITEELKRQEADWGVDFDALTTAVMEKIDELSE